MCNLPTTHSYSSKIAESPATARYRLLFNEQEQDSAFAHFKLFKSVMPHTTSSTQPSGRDRYYDAQDRLGRAIAYVEVCSFAVLGIEAIGLPAQRVGSISMVLDDTIRMIDSANAEFEKIAEEAEWFEKGAKARPSKEVAK